MISKNMSAGLNEQLNKEIYSGYLYLSMAAYASSVGLNGFANWFKVQMQEEIAHALKFYDYIAQQGEKVELKAIDEPPRDFSSGIDLFAKTLEHEKKVTRMIDDLVNIARQEKDGPTEQFLQWFVKEQIEEEATPANILKQLSLAGKDRNGILAIDSKLRARVFNLAQAVA